MEKGRHGELLVKGYEDLAGTFQAMQLVSDGIRFVLNKYFKVELIRIK